MTITDPGTLDATGGSAPGASVFDRLERLLPLVSKPIQYVGGELNATYKDWDAVRVHWALMYPDAYEVGAPNQGVQILYEVINERPDALAERTYAVCPDLEALMREHGVPQFTVDGHRPLGGTQTRDIGNRLAARYLAPDGEASGPRPRDIWLKKQR